MFYLSANRQKNTHDPLSFERRFVAKGNDYLHIYMWLSFDTT